MCIFYSMIYFKCILANLTSCERYFRILNKIKPVLHEYYSIKSPLGTFSWKVCYKNSLKCSLSDKKLKIHRHYKIIRLTLEMEN